MTERQTRKEKRNDEIVAKYLIMKDAYQGMTRKHTIVSKLSEQFDVCVSTIYKVLEARGIE